MKQEGKYRPLYEHLYEGRSDEVALTLAEIEALLGEALPTSARTARGWWSNRGSGSLQSAAWMSAGYRVTDIDLDRGRVTFRRARIPYFAQSQGDLWNGEMVRTLRAHMGLNQAQLAEELGVRQQTVSEWESGVYAPSRASSKHLALVAERANLRFGEETKE